MSRNFQLILAALIIGLVTGLSDSIGTYFIGLSVLLILVGIYFKRNHITLQERIISELWILLSVCMLIKSLTSPHTPDVNGYITLVLSIPLCFYQYFKKSRNAS